MLIIMIIILYIYMVYIIFKLVERRNLFNPRPVIIFVCTMKMVFKNSHFPIKINEIGFIIK